MDKLYRRLTDIYELDYYGAYKVMVFCCDWVEKNRGLQTFRNGHACVNFSKLVCTSWYLRDDPFVFSSQEKQVLYVEDEKQRGWSHVVKTKARDILDLGDNLS